ncbi:MAG: hypothetical protein Q8Q09_24540 [Deltaproteobacteria bacterium]|nr:hypothetical protein [Deltaproteobacteria bacterium]
MKRSPLHPLHNPGAPFAMNVAGVDFTAFSISGLSTYVLVPDFDACFDLGHCPVEGARLRNVLLSHVHQDHSLGVIRHRSLRQMWSLSGSRIVVPEGSREAMVEVLKAYDRLEGRHEGERPIEVQGVRPGDRVTLSKRFFADVFQVEHRIESVGFIVTERRRKLKPEYTDLPGVELGRLRTEGKELYDYRDHRAMTYVGDSTIETLHNVPEIFDAPLVFLECTHVAERDQLASPKYGHTHLFELLRFFERNPKRIANTHIVLKHFSTKYTHGEITQAFAKLPERTREQLTLLI